MDLISHVTLMGGATTRAVLVRRLGRRAVDGALRRGVLIRTARGRYALPTSRTTVLRASAVAGVLSHRSAAQHWGWAQKKIPDKAEVTVPRTRRVQPSARAWVIPHWADLGPEDVDGMVTSRRRTLVDCMRNLPLDEAVAIVDSALRADDITWSELVALAKSTKGRGRARICAVADAATSKAANAFESTLRAQCMLIPGLEVEPQMPVPVPQRHLTLHPDVGDPGLRLAIEAEGFAWHGDPRALTRDCQRYNLLGLLGWQVVRFSWAQVMHQPAYVHQTLVRAVELARQHANVATGHPDHPPSHFRHIRMSGGEAKSNHTPGAGGVGKVRGAGRRTS